MATTNEQALATPQEPIPLKRTGACWICGRDRWDRVFRDCVDLRYWPDLHPYDHGQHPPVYLVRCRNCGFAQPEVLPDLPHYFEVIYKKLWGEKELNTDFDATYRDFVYKLILADLERYGGPGLPRTLLDVGCSTGRFLYFASQAGWDAEGAESDPGTSAFAARRTGRPVYNCRAERLADDGHHFSVITLNDVLEHIPQPAQVVRNLRPLLHRGGILAIKVPHGGPQCFKELFRRHVLGRKDALHERVGVMTNFAHVNLFGVWSMRKMLEDTGFEVLRITTGGPELHTTRSAVALTRNSGRRLVFAVSRIVPGGVRSPLAMNLQVYARRLAD